MSTYISVEDRVPQDHRLRRLRRLVEVILGNMSGLFDEIGLHTPGRTGDGALPVPKKTCGRGKFRQEA
ncbi:hypothetical protein CJ010_10905 [Azoarcus sp. DD4]|uniref:hypothetical protein n=1 Tax=Azoarcus sp. DD4 TaxID=2027405 RepID=UPI0011271DA1|nr:hypothetical protein [Azoarcus sp. DD4]QDF97000.1 hypothetical protein CJ010_10905 [Azoarcus sp. DD4]